MTLISIYTRHDRAALLWGLLCQRDETVSISHRVMPSFREHVLFIESDPYQAWYFMMEIDFMMEIEKVVGACYLSKQNEIGVFVFGDSQGKGYATQAVKEVMAAHGERRYLANINPRNLKSVKLFNNLGFKHIQNTYECLPSRP